MAEISTHYFFQYISYAGKECSSFVNTKFVFDCNSWLNVKFDELVSKTPDLPDEIIKSILKKANVC